MGRMGALAMSARTNAVDLIRSAFRNRPGPHDPTGLRKLTALPSGTIKWALSELLDEGEIVRIARGSYVAASDVFTKGPAVALVNFGSTMAPEPWEQLMLVCDVMNVTASAFVRDATIEATQRTLASEQYRIRLEARLAELESAMKAQRDHVRKLREASKQETSDGVSS